MSRVCVSKLLKKASARIRVSYPYLLLKKPVKVLGDTEPSDLVDLHFELMLKDDRQSLVDDLKSGQKIHFKGLSTSIPGMSEIPVKDLDKNDVKTEAPISFNLNSAEKAVDLPETKDPKILYDKVQHQVTPK
jgi:hypothetical protein